jgi:HAD superfamily hydrolase (TIGR01509 family)
MKAVIFDLDGTLVDTTPVYLAIYLEVLKRELGLEPGERRVREKFGKKSTDIMVELLREMDIDPRSVDIEGVINRIRDEFKERIEEVLVLPGVKELLEKLKERYKLGVATSSRPYAALNVLKRFGLEGYFDCVVTGNDVMHSKPHPEIFLKTARKLGVKPKDCLVVEDAVYGIKAARAAGMRVVAVATGACSKEELEKAEPDLLLDSLENFNPKGIF